MKEQECNRYLRYLGIPAQSSRNKTRASLISARNPVTVIVVITGVLVLLTVSAVAYHAAARAGEGGASPAASSTAEEQIGFTSNASDGQEAPAAVSSSQAFWDYYASCPTCHKLAICIGLVTYCIAYVFGVS